MGSIPKQIQKLVEEREKLREEKQYKASDALRKRIEALGYQIADTQQGPHVSKKGEYVPPKQSFLVLFGSGEIAPSAVKVHERVLAGIGKDAPSIVIISTPAGFQPNVKVVCQEIKDFFEQHLKNYHPRVKIVYANTLEHANNPLILKPLETADYIFTGPGSPTYAVRHLKNSRLLKKVLKHVQEGASLGLASAATMAFSRFCLPVYEIYKAGFDLYWENGLNFYDSLLGELTIISHFNNNEGGKKNDTSRAWVGKKRFGKLLSLLPPAQIVWGIDEHTAVLIHLKTKKIEVQGKGELWNINRGDGKLTPLR